MGEFKFGFILHANPLIDSNRTMDEKPYKVGRFAHTLRVRLMREHLGVDVDALYEKDLASASPIKEVNEQTPWDPDDEQRIKKEEHFTEAGNVKRKTPAGVILKETADSLQQGLSFKIDCHRYFNGCH